MSATALFLTGLSTGAIAGGAISVAASAQAVRRRRDGTQIIALSVRNGGYSPSAVSAKPGVPTRVELVTAGGAS